MVLMRVLSIIIVLFLSTTSSLAHISILVSETGLEFAKDFLIHKLISTTIPLQLPDIEKKVKIPLIGKVRIGLSNITIDAVDVQSSSIGTGKDGIFLSVSGAKADLSMNWSNTYSASFFRIYDHGVASVKVKGMDVKVTVNLVDDNGSLKIVSVEPNCTVKSIGFHINGGASWLYKGVVDAFEKKIISTVEKTVSQKISEKMKKLDSILQSLPKERQIDDCASVNLSFTRNPVLGNSSVEVELDGLFMPKDHGKVTGRPRSSSLFRGVNKMVTVSVEEEVFNSATLVYFNAKQMQLDMEETKNGSTLSTSDWKSILPKLYKLYPDVKMLLSMSVESPPAVKITENGIDATIHLEISIGVQDSGKVLPIARLSSVLSAACSADIVDKNITGGLRLSDFNATTKWSRIGEFEAKNVEAATSKVLEALFLPYVNNRLKRGFSLPIPHGFSIKNLQMVYVEGGVLFGSDIDQQQQVCVS